jgi:hypothetical protein
LGRDLVVDEARSNRGPNGVPVLVVVDLTRLPSYHVYLKLLVDGTVSSPFSAETLPSWE